jgi:hypothetical protein
MKAYSAVNFEVRKYDFFWGDGKGKGKGIRSHQAELLLMNTPFLVL